MKVVKWEPGCRVFRANSGIVVAYAAKSGKGKYVTINGGFVAGTPPTLELMLGHVLNGDASELYEVEPGVYSTEPPVYVMATTAENAW